MRAARPRATTPCLPSDRTEQHCILGLLLGVACCLDGTCGLCREMVVRARRDGKTPDQALRSLALARRELLRRCPSCGFPPPPPFPNVPMLPRLDRTEHAESNSWNCRVCGKALSRGRRQFCSDDCYEQSEIARPRS